MLLLSVSELRGRVKFYAGFSGFLVSSTLAEAQLSFRFQFDDDFPFVSTRAHTPLAHSDMSTQFMLHTCDVHLGR